MPHALEAVVEADGRLRLLEPADLRAGARVLVTPLADEAVPNETALLSQATLGADWDRAEEDEAWAHLQP